MKFKNTKWDRLAIEAALQEWVELYETFQERDLCSQNNLPSLLTVLRHFPEYSTLNEIKAHFNLTPSQTNWTRETALQAGKDYVEKHGILRSIDLRRENNLPTLTTIVRLFETVRNYQAELGAKRWTKNRRVGRIEFEEALEKFFADRLERKVNSKTDFFREFPYGQTVVRRLYGNVERFLQVEKIEVADRKHDYYERTSLEA